MRVVATVLACAALVSLLVAVPSCAESNESADAHVVIDLAIPVSDLAGADALDLSVSDHPPSLDLTPICDLGSSPLVDGGDGSAWFASATTTSGNNWAALWRDGTWSEVPVGGAGLTTLVASSFDTTPLVIGRGNDDSLVSALYEPCAAVVPPPMPLFAQALTAERPAAIGGARVDVIFRGSINADQRLYATSFTGTWQAATALGNFLSTLPPAVVRDGSDVHAIFTGTDGTIYDGLVNTSGGTATQLPSSSSDQGPAAVVADDGTPWVVWKGSDTNLVWSTRSMSGYAVPTQLCAGQTGCLIASNVAPVLALDSAGIPVVAWLGKSDAIVYTARWLPATSQWSPAFPATNEPSTLLPALARGGDGTDFELVYVRGSDGLARHVRNEGGSFTAPITLPGAALASQPSLLRTAP